MQGLGRDRVVEPVSIVFSTSFRYTSSWCALQLVHCDSLLQHLRQSFRFVCIGSNKHVENVKPSHNAPFDVLTFDILTRVMVFEEVGRVEGR